LGIEGILEQICVSLESDGSTNIFGLFFNPPELRKRDKKVAKLAVE
jgi:hypothetical protein